MGERNSEGNGIALQVKEHNLANDELHQG
jgi:hypothetical protein